MLPAKCSDPEIIRGDGATSLFECCSNPGRRELMSAHSMGLFLVR